MPTYLVVAHQTAASPELILKLRELAGPDEGAEFVLLVPATPPAHLLTWVEGEREEIARRRASDAEVDLRNGGINVIDARVGDADPLLAIRQEHGRGRHSYALTVISTLSPGLSRWLKRGLATQVRLQLGVPVIEVIARRQPEHPVAISTFGEQSGAVSGDAIQSLDLRAMATWRGQILRCADGDAGHVHEIVYDYVTSQPLWVGVASRPLPFRTLLVPAQLVQVQDRSLWVNLTRDKLMGQPDVSIGEGIASLSDEEDLFHYFGMPFEMRDERVLRLGQYVPGAQQNQQAIFESVSQPVRR